VSGRDLKTLALLLSVAAAQSLPTAPKKGGNPEAAKIKNPVAATPESTAAGKRAYQRLCVKCHGPEGQGDGGAATGAVPPDLTDVPWDYGSSDGDVFAVIHDGTSPDMEGYAGRLNDTEIWNIVNYVKTLKQP
jgi:mono/diheme cytochrome c family protein